MILDQALNAVQCAARAPDAAAPAPQWLWFPFATIPAPCRRSSVPFAPHTRSLRARSSRPQPVTNSTAAVATIAKRTNLIFFRSPCRWCGTARNAAPHKMESQPPSNHCWQGIKGTRDARFRPQRMVLGRKANLRWRCRRSRAAWAAPEFYFAASIFSTLMIPVFGYSVPVTFTRCAANFSGVCWSLKTYILRPL